jgi:hypothetical protein
MREGLVNLSHLTLALYGPGSKTLTLGPSTRAACVLQATLQRHKAHAVTISLGAYGANSVKRAAWLHYVHRYFMHLMTHVISLLISGVPIRDVPVAT